MWGLCDFTVRLVAELVHNSPVRNSYHEVCGWYFNGTIAKILVIVRDMMIQLANPDREVWMTKKEWQVIADLPDQINDAKDCLLNEGIASGPFEGALRTHLSGLAEAVADEALEPTVFGTRGYEEVS